MQNLRLYEDLEGSHNPDFSTLVTQLTEFFEPNIFSKGYKNPSKYFAGNLTYGQIAKGPKNPKEKFTEVINFIIEQNYEFTSLPTVKGFDFKRYFRVMKSLELEFGKLISESQYAIALPTTRRGRDYYFLIGITDKYTNFRVLKPGEDHLLCDRSQNYDKGFEGIIWTDDSLVGGEFTLESYEYSGTGVEDGTSAIYNSTKTSNGKKYSLEIGVFMFYKNEIENLDDIISLNAL
jgi:hypothetical protein